MKKHEMSLINPKSVNADQVGELMSPIVAEVLKLTSARRQYWIGRKRKLQMEIRNLLAGANGAISEEFQSWIDLYRDEFGIELNLEALAIPEYQPETWLVTADERVTNNQVYDACQKHFTCSRYIDDLNTIRDLHMRGTIARRFKAVVEADEENANKSANDIANAGLEPKAITLKERMLLELWYFRTTGRHLDIRNWTICAGSRDAVGGVPRVGWSGVGSMRVGGRSADDRGGSARARLAVS